MVKRRPAANLVRLLMGGAVLAVAGPAAAQDSKKAACASSYERSQELRASAKLREAREALVICAQDGCPAFVQSDCAQWLVEVQRELPTVVFSAKDKEGTDTTAVKVTIDGEVVAEELDGKPIPINPGAHKLRFELEGADPVETQLVVSQGQKDRVVPVSFAPRGSDLPPDSPYAGAVTEEPVKADEPAEESGKPGPLRPYAFIAGGVGAAGLIGWVVLGAVGKSKENELRDTCKPDCSKSDVDSVRTTYVLADISLGLGIAGLGTGVALFFLSQPKSGASSDSEEATRLRWNVAATPEGGFATMNGRF